MGTPDTAVPSLEAILAAGHDVPLVCTQPDRPAGRSKTPQAPPVKRLAASRRVAVIQPETVRTPAFLEALVAAAPEVIAVVAYGRILPRPVLDVAPQGAVNLHFSLLPALRGAAPVAWALARGETITGVTTFRIDDGLDTGDVLAQRSVPVLPGEHAPALLSRLAIEGAALLVETLSGLAAGSIERTPQDHGRATSAPMLSREAGLWSPAWTAAELEGRVRGFDPWPGVWAGTSGKRIRIVEARALADERSIATAGSVLALDGTGLRLACAGGTVAVIDAIQPQGGRAMRAAEAINGRWIRPGDRLERPEPTA
jgi:methionyl-tRNA formyltransferase